MFITDDDTLSALRAVADQTTEEERSGYTSVLQGEHEGILGSSSVTRVSRKIRNNTAHRLVSTSVLDGTKLQ